QNIYDLFIRMVLICHLRSTSRLINLSVTIVSGERTRLGRKSSILAVLAIRANEHEKLDAEALIKRIPRMLWGQRNNWGI
ncbi:MAG: hypothetical protein WB988_00525, partial [Candidatus Nitrosopolaris sp.]